MYSHSHTHLCSFMHTYNMTSGNSAYYVCQLVIKIHNFLTRVCIHIHIRIDIHSRTLIIWQRCYITHSIYWIIHGYILSHCIVLYTFFIYYFLGQQKAFMIYSKHSVIDWTDVLPETTNNLQPFDLFKQMTTVATI